MDLANMIIESGAIMFGDFTLTSGKKSNYYINIKKAITKPEILKEIAIEMSKKIKDEYIVGIELGSVPIAVAVSLEIMREYVIVRKEQKSHGTGSLIEGEIKKNSKYVVIEDVITTGSSVLRAVNAIRGEGGIVERVICVVDREEGGEENLKNYNVKLDPLLKVSEILKRKF
ncbi:MAG: orotate phosphoribosyltransferase [Thermoplasmata archaeon]|jgi:orotate phosphoribosyltransferase